jgi:glycosyltransferase involved in cell wall biosynthesis
MATYNGEKFIIDTINSIRSQTFSDFECVIVDDHSTDNTANIVSDICKEDKRFKLFVNITNPDFPYADAHNMSYRLGQGELLFRFDQDDIMHPDFLEKMIKYMDENKDVTAASCFIHRTEFNNETNSWEVNDIVNSYVREYIDLFSQYPDFYFWKAACQGLWQIWNNNASVIRKEFLENNKDVKFIYPSSGDYCFWLNVIRKNGKLRINEEFLVDYKNYDESTWHDKSNAYNNLNDPIAQYYVAYLRYKCFLRYPKSLVIDGASIENIQQIFLNTVRYFRDKLKGSNKWNEIEDYYKYEC